MQCTDVPSTVHRAFSDRQVISSLDIELMCGISARDEHNSPIKVMYQVIIMISILHMLVLHMLNSGIDVIGDAHRSSNY